MFPWKVTLSTWLSLHIIQEGGVLDLFLLADARHVPAEYQQQDSNTMSQ